MSKAAHFEARKWAYRQCKEGTVVSFLVHPNDITPELATAPLGSRMMVAFANIGDDEQPKPQEKPRKSWDSYSKAQQAGILCADKTFQQWMDCPTEMETIAEVRCYCGVKSRTELDLDTKAGADWDKLVSKYRTATGQMAEAR